MARQGPQARAFSPSKEEKVDRTERPRSWRNLVARGSDELCQEVQLGHIPSKLIAIHNSSGTSGPLPQGQEALWPTFGSRRRVCAAAALALL